MGRTQSFQFRYTIGSTLVLTIALSVVGSLFYQLSMNSAENMLMQRVLTMSRLGALFLNVSDSATMQGTLQKLDAIKNGKAFVAILSTQDPTRLHVIASARGPEVNQDIEMPQAAKEAFVHHAPAVSHVFQREGEDWIHAFVPLTDEKSQITAVLGLETPVGSELHESAQKRLWVILICISIAAAAAMAFGHLVSSSILTPIHELTQVANAIVAGDFSARVPIRGRNELSGFAITFNEMMDQIKGTKDEVLKQANELFGHATELEATIQKRTTELADARETIQAMVDSLNEGFLVFDQTGICRDVSSTNCMTLLEGRPNLRPVHEVLRIPEAELPTFERWLRTLFSNKLPFADLAPLGPKRFKHSKNKIIELKYYPLWENDRKLKSVVIVASDRTEELNNQKLAREKEKRANFVLKAAQMGQAMDNFFSSAERDMTNLRLEIADLRDSKTKVSGLISIVHTIKGEAAIFALDDVTKVAHTLEDLMRSYEKNPSTEAETEMTRQLLHLQEVMLEHRMAFYEINIRSGGPDLAAIREQRAKLVEMIDRMKDLDMPKEFRIGLFKYGISQQIGWFFSIYSQFIQDMAIRLGKRVDDVEFVNADLPIYAEPYLELFRTMIHLIRNSLDHGLETPTERMAAAKPESGHLTLKFERYPVSTNKWNVRIELSDDGRGINPKMIRERLSLRKGESYVDSLSDDEVLQQIFDPGFSTKQNISELSGRGVGLWTVKQECLNLGGDIFVKSTPGQGTIFTIEIPDSYDQLINSSTKKAS